MMRALSILLLLLALLCGPGWAVDAPVAAVDADAADTGLEIHAPTSARTEQPARTIRLEPPERSLPDVVPHDLRATSLPHPALAAAPPRTPTPRPWGPSPALHVELCVFLC